MSSQLWASSFWKCLLFCDRSFTGIWRPFCSMLAGWEWHFSSHRLLFQAGNITTRLGDPKYRGYHWDASLGDQLIYTQLGQTKESFWIYLKSGKLPSSDPSIPGLPSMGSDVCYCWLTAVFFIQLMWKQALFANVPVFKCQKMALRMPKQKNWHHFLMPI